MTDIVKRLAFGYLRLDNANKDAIEAANIITSLRAEVERLTDEAVQRIQNAPDGETIARAVAEYGSAEGAVRAAMETEMTFHKARAEAAEAKLAVMVDALEVLEEVKQCCLFDDDGGRIGVTERKRRWPWWVRLLCDWRLS